jgi:hypothetical protein
MPTDENLNSREFQHFNTFVKEPPHIIPDDKPTWFYTWLSSSMLDLMLPSRRRTLRRRIFLLYSKVSCTKGWILSTLIYKGADPLSPTLHRGGSSQPYSTQGWILSALLYTGKILSTLVYKGVDPLNSVQHRGGSSQLFST